MSKKNFLLQLDVWFSNRWCKTRLSLIRNSMVRSVHFRRSYFLSRLRERKGESADCIHVVFYERVFSQLLIFLQLLLIGGRATASRTVRGH